MLQNVLRLMEFPLEKVQGIIAGGNEAIFKAKENAEDNPELGKTGFVKH